MIPYLLAPVLFHPRPTHQPNTTTRPASQSSPSYSLSHASLTSVILLLLLVLSFLLSFLLSILLIFLGIVPRKSRQAQFLRPPFCISISLFIHSWHAPSFDDDFLLVVGETNVAVGVHDLLSVFGVLARFVLLCPFAAADQFGCQEVFLGDVGQVAGGLDLRGFFVAGWLVTGL